MVKTQVFLREKQKHITVPINPDFTELVDDLMLQKWQKMINLVADILEVKAGLIMRITEKDMEVFLRSENEDNPYPGDGKDHLGHGLYCETVIGENRELHVDNSLHSDVWKDNPDVQINMISYHGLPIKYPDGSFFGTICALDNKTIPYSEKYHDLLEQFRSAIETDLQLLLNMKQMSDLLEFRSLITEASGLFAQVDDNKSFNEVIDRVLSSLGNFFEVDRCYFFGFSEDLSTITSFHEWCASEITEKNNRIEQFSLNNSQWFKTRMLELQPLQIPEVTALPEEAAAEKKYFQSRGIQSLICLPICANHNKLTGLIRFDAVHAPQNWPEDQVGMLQMLAEIVSSTLSRVKATRNLAESEEKSRAILSTLPDLMFVYSRDGYHLDYHVPDQSQLHIEPEMFINKSVHEMFPKEVADKLLQGFKRVYETNQLQVIDFALDLPDGLKHYEARVASIDEQRLITIVRDITERKISEDKLKKSEGKYREILDTIEEGYYEVDLAGNFVFFNDSFCRILGYDQNELMGQNYQEIYKEPGEVYAAFNRVYRTGKPEKAFCWPVTTRDGRKINVELSITLRRDDNDNPLGFSGIAKDVTERIQYEDKLKYLSLHDQLTGLYNRHFFMEEIRRLSKSRDYPITIISADIDGLKQINDLKGHAKGDEYLKSCAEVLSKSLRSSDILARIGGDEFVMLLPRTDRKAGESILERISNQVAEHNKKHPEIPISLSLGLATAASNDIDLEEVYKQADRLMLKNKLTARGKPER